MNAPLFKSLFFIETCLTNLNFVKGNQNIQRSVLEKSQLINKLLASYNFQVNEFRTRTQSHCQRSDWKYYNNFGLSWSKLNTSNFIRIFKIFVIYCTFYIVTSVTIHYQPFSWYQIQFVTNLTRLRSKVFSLEKSLIWLW